MPNNRLQPARVNAIDLTDDPDVLVLIFVFWDHHVRGWVVLLVAHEDVWDKGTLARQERYSHLDRLSMPVLGVFAVEVLILNLFLKLVEEPVLGAHTEVTYSKEAHLFKDKFSWQLKLYSRLTQEVLKRQRWNLHDIADIKTIYPLTLIQIAQYVFHIWYSAIVKTWAGRAWRVSLRWISIVQASTQRCDIPFSIWGNITPASLWQFDGASNILAAFLSISIIFNGHFLLNIDENWM